MGKGITPRQRAFVEAYLTTWNASEAARRAGYSAKTAGEIGYENLKKPEIQAEIDSHLTEMGMTAAEVLARLTAHARGDVSHFLVQRGDEVAIDLSGADAQAHLYLIKKVRQRRRILRQRDGSEIEEIEMELELHDPQAALVQLGRFHKLFVDRQEHTGKDGAPLHPQGVVTIFIPDNGRGDS